MDGSVKGSLSILNDRGLLISLKIYSIHFGGGVVFLDKGKLLVMMNRWRFFQSSFGVNVSKKVHTLVVIF